MTYWTYAEIKAKIENDLDLKQETFITPEEMMGYCNEAIDEAESEIHTLYEDYFLTKANIALVNGTAEYSLPTNIYANKIRAIVYDNGSETYAIKRFKEFDKFLDIALTNRYVTDQWYRYIIVNNSATAGMKIYLVPKARETSSTNITVWYIRNANKITLDADKVDIPEFANFIIQYMKVRCYEKEGNPNLPKAIQDLEQQRKQMIDTLTAMIPDAENELEKDFTYYEEIV